MRAENSAPPYPDRRYGTVPRQADPSIPKDTPERGNQAFRPLGESEKAAPRSGLCSFEVDALVKYQVRLYLPKDHAERPGIGIG